MSSCCTRFVLLCAVLSLWAGMVVGGEGVGDQDGVRRIGLSSGLEVVVVPGGPAEREGSDGGAGVEVWLVVRAGTMDERADERGSAYVAERLARQGIGGLDREAIDAMLMHEGPEPHPARALGSVVTLDQTIFMGHADAGDADSLRELLGFYAAVLDPGLWSVSSAGLGSARDELVAKFESLMSPKLRARQQWLPELLGEQSLGAYARLPETHELESLDLDSVRSFIGRGYRASRATLIVVGNTGRLDFDALLADTLGGMERTDRGVVRDLRGDLEGDAGGARFVMGLDPQIEGHQVAMVWVRADEDACLDAWSVCASGFDESQLRGVVRHRVALELIRHRLRRLLVASLGGDIEISVDGIGLAGQVDLVQCVIEGAGVSEEDWSRSLRALIRESDRLAQGGAGSDEIARARGSLLARWHREADAWRGTGPGERVWLVHWLVTGGRPVMDAVAWDEHATRIMSGISDAQVNAAVREMLDPGRSRHLAVTRGDPGDARAMDGRVREVAAGVRSEPIGPIDPDWMRTLGGSLLDGVEFHGVIEQVTQHAPSGTWGATLGNGVRVWARHTDGGSSGEKQDRVHLSVMLWGAMFGDGSLREAEIDAAMLVWNTPSSELRDAGWLAVFCESRGIEVRSRRVVGGVQLQISASVSAHESALELLYLLLDRPMIDAGAFAKWERSGGRKMGMDPVERGLAELYSPGMLGDGAEAVEINDAQRALTRMVRNANISVGIAGAIDAGDMIERAGATLGELVSRETTAARTLTIGDGVLGGRVRELEVVGKEDGLVAGVLGGSLEDLDTLRATILASMVLQHRAESVAKERGLEIEGLGAHVVMSDALGDRWAVLLRAQGADAGSGVSLLHEVGERLMSEGIEEAELVRVKDELDGSIGRHFDSARYWSVRLSGVGLHGRSVEDLWSIRERYAGVDADAATRALRGVLGRGERGGERFVLRVVGPAGR